MLIGIAGCSSSPAPGPTGDAGDADASDTGVLVGDAGGADGMVGDVVIADDLGRAMDTGPVVDVPVVDTFRPECVAAGDCDDHADCTDDTCVSGSCVHTPLNARCDDSIACTDDVCMGGVCQHNPVPARCMASQTCDPRMGCTGGRVCANDRDCADMDPCTTNERCDPASRVCRTDTLDGDADGHPPRVCGGDDCDDGSREIHAGASERCNGADDDCDGTVDEAPAGLECGRGFVCRTGSCACAPPTPTRCSIFPAEFCADLQTDRDSCGRCGRSCGSTGTCGGGVCQCTGGGTFCVDSGCVDLQSDSNHCGRCDNRCPGTTSCIAGQCRCTGTRTACEGVCVALETDRANCGRCGASCPLETTCVAGTCRCPPGRTLCGERCVDLQTDGSHCGRCDNSCPGGNSDAGVPGSMCEGGACLCEGGATLCSIPSGPAYCADTRTDGYNCGACGNSCSVSFGEACSDGVCGCSSSAPLRCEVRAGSGFYGCFNGQANPSHCGTCGNACARGASCVSGRCVCPGAMGLACGGACLDAASDTANCGTCGNACARGASCVGGRCVCPGVMGLACGGACLDAASDTANCGACGNACARGASCVGGRCVCPGVTGLVCGDACTDAASDTANCGACGNTCARGASCVSGRCVCPSSAPDTCSATCVDTRADAVNCGTCGRRCGALCSDRLCVDVAEVAMGFSLACARMSDGTARCWGRGDTGGLGYTPTTSCYIGFGDYLRCATRPQPLPGASRLVQIAVGSMTCALTDGGAVLCWGSGMSAALVPGLSNVARVAVGSGHACVLLHDGTVRCWGSNEYGQLGDGTTTSRASPVEVAGLTAVADIALGGQHSCARMIDGTVRCWGGNDFGEVGAASGDMCGAIFQCERRPVSIPSLSNVVGLAVGDNHNCVRSSDGTVRCWGESAGGQLGVTVSDPCGSRYVGYRSCSRIPVTVPGLSSVVELALGGEHTLARRSDGTVLSWGSNARDQLGDPGRPSGTTPLPVPGLAGVVQIDAQVFTSCARLRDGSLLCWGDNWLGELGDGSTTRRPAPTAVNW